MRSLRAAFGGCALLLAGACVPGAANLNPSSGPRPMAWTPDSPAGEISTWALEGCRRAAGGKDACIERTLVGLIDQTGIARSMEVLDTLAGRDPRVRDQAHALAHGLGIAAYRGPQTMAATFAACPVSQMSGCYHGVIQGYFLDLARQGKPIGAAELDALCEPHRGQPFMFFQCAHGMGHGLMTAHENHLPMALESCDLVTDEFARSSCWGGAFMENVVNVSHPHHTAGGHAQTQGGGHGSHGAQAAEAHGAHGHHGGGDGHGSHGAQGMRHGEWRALDRDDPLYPCNAVDEKYGYECYGMQTSAIMFFNGGDVAATTRACEGAPEKFRERCFMSLGRDVTSWVAHDFQRTIAACGGAGQASAGWGRIWCQRGAVETLVNQSANPQDGIRFCRLVEGAEAKNDCYEAVGRFMRTLVAAAEGRARQCASAETEHVAACRRGAEVDPSVRVEGQ